MLPSLVAEDLRASLTSFLGTTFALADDDVRAELERFIADPHDGVFRGPYVRLRLPFRPADDTWRSFLDWAPPGFCPHHHQAQAWIRLASRDRLPRPTLVTTGTGSGKTESFLIPLLEHCRRQRAARRPGIKALVLYPMNALANDQARRIAKLVYAQRGELGDVTVGLYTGDSGKSIAMSENAVIEDRRELRKNPPDILLTNYKMLDMLLLRGEDAPLFAGAGESLRYLVLDEFHTYDGAQGTDVAMLLRRLGIALGVAADERPLGAITPIATSATLGSGEAGGPALRHFAETVFGAEFDESSLIGENRLTVDEWVGGGEPQGTIPLLDEVTAALRAPRSHEEQLREGARLFLGNLELTGTELAEALRVHPFTRSLLRLTSTPRSLTDLALELEPSWSIGSAARQAAARHAIALYLALLSRARTPEGAPLLGVDVQLWLREISRLLRQLSSVPRFGWFEGAAGQDGVQTLPSVFCRHCGRSGWGVLATPGGGVATTPTAVWRKSMTEPAQARAWIFAPREAAQGSTDVRWVDPEIIDFVAAPAGKHSNEIPVLVTPDGEAARKQQCPSCGRDDGIRFLGSRVATLASAALSQLFGSADVADAEKKTLVFTDSVQDASHRAAFVESRAYALNLRALIHRAIGEEGCTLDALGAALEASADTPNERYALLPPDLREHETFRQYWKDKPATHVRRHVARRTSFAATLEFGLSSRTGRTLELTGAATAYVEVADLDAVVRAVLHSVSRQEVQLTFGGVGRKDVQLAIAGVGPEEAQLSLDEARMQQARAWARGLLERVRTQGGIAHRWLTRYTETDDRYPIWGGRPRREGMPAFPKGRAAPAFPTTAQHPVHLDTVLGPRNWYSSWTARMLGVPTVDAPRYVIALLNALVGDGALRALNGKGGSAVWQIPAERVRIARASGTPAVLRCTVCRSRLPGPDHVLRELTGAACQRDRCPGSYRLEPGEHDYYRGLYRAGGVRRIIAREHTSLLPAEERVELENSFKAGRTPDAPNVLTCTPTLELGIDIGDLSTVALTSLPRSTASYLQRVGRAGRLTGNALILSLLPARPLELQRLADPLTMIAGEVVPPACYLDATEILRRQYLASLVDRRARASGAKPTRLAKDVFAEGLTPTSWLGTLIANARTNAKTYLDDFLRGFGTTVSAESATALRLWAGDGSPAGEPPGLERAIESAAAAWTAEGEEIADRIGKLQAEITAMEERPSLDEAGERDLRRLRGELGAARAARSARERTYWISALEAAGLLPNYALLDDTTRLDVGLWWTDEETGEARSTDEQYVRGSRTALAELAPGATFYVRGTSVEIDGIDLGTSRNPATVRRRFCPACGWSRQVLDGQTVTACPRCGNQAAADAGQVLNTLPFRRASAYASRELAMRDDDSDERRRARFTVVTTVDSQSDDITAAWQLADFPFGVEVLRAADIRWVNLGPSEKGGASITLAGQQVNAPLFHACRHCGVVPAAQRGVTDRTQARHRGWCRQRRKFDVDGWVTVALTHELRTQAVRLLVPPIVVADPTVRTSFRAALLLGLRELLGGEPEHLDVVEAMDPIPGSGERWVMVLHDLVPGGTGYLRQFAEPAQVRKLVEAALLVLRGCPCRSEGLAACHRCLLPHLPPTAVPHVRRDTAADLIGQILEHWEPEPVTTIKKIVVGPHDTPIEARLRALLIRWAKTKSATVETAATSFGDSAKITLPAALGGHQWSLTPQVKLGGVQPDFVLQCGDHEVSPIAVFCDSIRYHSSAEQNRLADDAGKRSGLRDADYLVWAVTHEDLDAFAAALDGGPASPATWLHPDQRVVAGQIAQKFATPGSKPVNGLLADAISVLTEFLTAPKRSAWTPPAHAIALSYCREQPRLMTDLLALPALLAGQLTGAGTPKVPGGIPIVIEHSARGALLVLERRTPKDIRVWLGLDDRDTAVGTPAQIAAWRDWLALSNVLQFLEPGRFVAHTANTATGTTPGPSAAAVSAGWLEIADVWEGAPRRLILALAVGGLPVPESGLEVEDGQYQIDLAWPEQRVAVVVEPDDELTGWLNAHAWTVAEPDEQAVRAALAAAGKQGEQ